MATSTNYDEGLRRMSRLVNSLLTRADCGPFREPVDWRELGLFDYPKIIKKVRFLLMHFVFLTEHFECAGDEIYCHSFEEEVGGEVSNLKFVGRFISRC